MNLLYTHTYIYIKTFVYTETLEIIILSQEIAVVLGSSRGHGNWTLSSCYDDFQTSVYVLYPLMNSLPFRKGLERSRSMSATIDVDHRCVDDPLGMKAIDMVLDERRSTWFKRRLHGRNGRHITIREADLSPMRCESIRWGRYVRIVETRECRGTEACKQHSHDHLVYGSNGG